MSDFRHLFRPIDWDFLTTMRSIKPQENELTEKKTSAAPKPAFNPFLLIGTFWTVFGVLVLISIFFVSGTSYVPHTRAVGANLVAALVLIGIGVTMLRKGRRRS